MAFASAIPMLTVGQLLIRDKVSSASLSTLSNCLLDQALHILTQMRCMQVPVNAVAASGAITACEKSSAWLEAIALFQVPGQHALEVVHLFMGSGQS